MAELNHICLDLETLSTNANAVIVTIAAVKFSFASDETEEFCVNINPFESKSLGLHIDPLTLDWWRERPEEVRQAWKLSPIGLSGGLDGFDTFCGQSKHKYWANGVGFDFPILDSSYKILGRKTPYNYWNTYDMRTAYYLAGFDTKNAPRVGQYHNAIDDCKTQILHLKMCLGVKQ